MRSNPLTRRHFLKTAATAVTAFQILPRHVLGGPRFVPPSEKVNLAVVGVGGRGTQNLKALLALTDAQVSAIADPADTFSLQNYYYKGVLTGGWSKCSAQAVTAFFAGAPEPECAPSANRFSPTPRPPASFACV